jgi:hypothetical protein
LFRATEDAGGPWSPDLLQGSATIGLMTREVERLALASDFAVRRLTFDLWRPVGLRAFAVTTDMLRDGRKAKTMQVRLMDGETEISRCTALLTKRESLPSVCKGRRRRRRARRPARRRRPLCVVLPERLRAIDRRRAGKAVTRPRGCGWMRLWSKVTQCPLLRAVQAADFASGVAQIVDMRQWSSSIRDQPISFAPGGGWILVRSCTRVGEWRRTDHGDAKRPQGAVCRVMQAMSFERREAV